MRAYILNIPESVVKKQKVVFVGENVEIKSYDHSIANHIDMKIDYNHHKELYGFRLSENEILNFISHFKIWEDFLICKEEWCLVLESNINAVFPKKEIERTIKDLSLSDADWDIFFPYNTIVIRENYFETKNGKNLLNFNIQEIEKRHLYFLNFKWGNSIYILSRKGAEKLLQIGVIKDRLDDTILELSNAQQLCTYYDTVDWFTYDSIIQYEWLDRCENILACLQETMSWSQSAKSKVRDLLNMISKIGIQNKIDLLLQGGTHLGYIRHGGIMSWDDDVDIGIEESHKNIFFEELSRFNSISFGEYIELRTNAPYYKIWRKDGELIEGYDYTFPFIDLWIYNRIGEDIIFKNGIICPNSAKKPFLNIDFEGAKFQIVSNSFEVLDSRYSDWRNFIHIYTHSHRLESSIRHYVCIPIQTDEKGQANFPIKEVPDNSLKQ